ncbi:MAG: hypothetical protein KGO03_04075, partial [Gemmatimonadota bacterium]|nr:hypothetical protein [Gemmatimonadota bacterium]
YVDHAMAEHGLVAVAGAGALAGVTMHDRSPAPRRLAGAPTTIEFEAVVQGEMPERDFDLLAETIRRRIGEAGALAAVGRSLTWNALGKQRAVHVSVLARNGRTTVRAVENMGQLAGGLFGGIIGGAGGGMTGAIVAVSVKTLHSPRAAILMELGWLGAMYALARGIFTYTVRKRKNILRQLTEELADQIRQSASGEPPALPPSAPRILEP